MANDATTEVITQPALGQDLELGVLYDARTSQFFGVLSLWKHDIVNAKQYSFSYSIEEARSNSDLKGSISLDLKLFSTTSSAKYLGKSKSNTHEARLNASCTIKVLSTMTCGNHLDNPQFTHFFAEVVKGGSATLSFVKTSSTEEESKKASRELKISIVKIPINGTAKVDFSDGSENKFENVRISYSGAMAENVGNLEDANRVAREMPTKLAKQMNTLSYKLLSLSLLGSEANRLIRSLNDVLLNNTAAVLKAGTAARLKLEDLFHDPVFQKRFPAIKQQIESFQSAFSAVETEFTKDARRLLRKLRDGNTDENAKISELQASCALFQQRIEIAKNFISKEEEESDILQTTVAALLEDKFEDHLSGFKARSIIDDGVPRLLLSFGGPKIMVVKHPLQVKIESKSSGPNPDKDYDAKTGVRESCAALRLQRLLGIPGAPVIFGVAFVNRARRPTKENTSKINVGDIILEEQGKFTIITGMLGKIPTAPTLKVDNQTITLSLPKQLWVRQHGVDRTSKLPSAARDLIEFFDRNEEKLSKAPIEPGLEAGEQSKSKPWDRCHSKKGSHKKTLYLGLSEIARRSTDEKKSQNERFPDKTTVRIVDVAPDFKPEIQAASMGDQNKTVVVVFSGTSDHGKSTEINAFISYLLGGELTTPRPWCQAVAVSNADSHLLPHSTTGPVFHGKTLLIVVTPGYGDSRGAERDAFVNTAMSDFFKAVDHVNSIVSPASGGENDASIRNGWLASVKGQYQLMQVISKMTFVSTRNSSAVARAWIRLEQKCELAEKKILKTAMDAENITLLLGLLAGIVGSSPEATIDITTVEVKSKNTPEGKYTTLCLNCQFTCHEICACGNDADKIKCVAITDGNCIVCKNHCSWEKHRNSSYILYTEQVVSKVIPDELIKRWNSTNNSAEGALISVMDKYLQLQQTLRADIMDLAALSEQLTKGALLHNPEGLINYMETLIQTARARDADPALLTQLATAKNTLILQREIKGKGVGATRDSVILFEVIGTVRTEMERRMNLQASGRAAEEEKSCTLYNDLRDKLPTEIRVIAPAALKVQRMLSKGALYPENLRAAIALVQIVFKNGGVVAALAAGSENGSA
ncbi:hypothetical protein GQ44DRAFT_757223 [Phaeosphaeriaceae sp. PMI808]|nr:hypothetical protein GQ44DRAFT_757223 [Phaeosphaeriaceae sp. PMI808]